MNVHRYSITKQSDDTRPHRAVLSSEPVTTMLDAVAATAYTSAVCPANTAMVSPV